MTVASQLKQTLASLKSAQGTIRTYALQSQEEELRNIFQESLETTGEIINSLEDRLKKIEFEEPQYKGN
ncbi:DUF1657 domain-containing protein [Candidatus Contubernalis alkaliaceticus]|uniref:DUF1657 domain-containing protein n=1 Tax=Candidatus Contubernalis alkaliaceticus TaxID=338645 RepID=UPI001F4C193E|nr:DUF1657 domain-containing protein [Candidatus Contubernalis alkalaceticus]UNC93305.1 DUF1657 domain-containing protein [Candidatus Contubernalis alkalaceticus]